MIGVVAPNSTAASSAGTRPRRIPWVVGSPLVFTPVRYGLPSVPFSSWPSATPPGPGGLSRAGGCPNSAEAMSTASMRPRSTLYARAGRRRNLDGFGLHLLVLEGEGRVAYGWGGSW